MSTIDNEATPSHDHSSISPSAYTLLMMKGDTTIPYAREAAALLKQAAGAKHENTPNSGVTPVDYWTRVMHFESRYWSIDQLLEDQPYTNILELSSGFSFRGLALSHRQPVFYIDTDLEGVIAGKQRFVDALTESSPAPGVTPGDSPGVTPGDTPGPTPSDTPGHYELQPLNVLDPAAFKKIIARFPPGPIAIVNEGLLVYLDNAEKECLCENIRNNLLTRGGCWITADIYLQKQAGSPPVAQSESYRLWQEQHKIEEKKFSNIREAEAFFHRMGFTVDKQARPNYDRLSSLTRLREASGHATTELPTTELAATELATSEHSTSEQPGRTRQHATWRLVAQKNAAGK